MHGEVSMDPTGSTTYAVLASINGFTIEFSRDKVDVTAFGDTNKVYVQGFADIKGTLKGWWEALASRTLFNVALGEIPCGLKLVPSTLDPTAFYSGLAYLDSSIDVAADGAVALSGNWAAAGPWAVAPGIVATGATAGTPGTFTPTGATAPANLAAMTGKTASPNTAWTTGQHVVLGDASKAYWNATTWVVGMAP